jgi:hypothetical protein
MARQWYYSQNGKQQGPVSVEQLKQLAQSGALLPTDLLWADGFREWRPASAAKGLVFPETRTASKPVPPPLPGGGPYTPSKKLSPAIPPPSAARVFAPGTQGPSSWLTQAYEIKRIETPKTRRPWRVIALISGGLLSVPFLLLLIGSLVDTGDSVTGSNVCLNKYAVDDLATNTELMTSLIYQAAQNPMAVDEPEKGLALAKGTAVRVLKRELDPCNHKYVCDFVRVVSGPHKGVEGWVVDRCLIRE